MGAFKLGRKKEYRERTMRNLLTSFVLYESLTTTKAKAKALRPAAERLIRRSQSGSLADRRYAKSILFDDNAVKKLFEDLSTRWDGRTSGLVRLTNLPPRMGDGSAMARLELVVKPLDQVISEETNTTLKVRKTNKPAAEKAKKAEKEEAEQASEDKE